MTYGAFLSVAVETSETRAMPWDDVYAIATPGRVFDMFTNQAQALRGRGRRRPGGSLMLFAGARAAARSRASPTRRSSHASRDLHDLYPQTRGAIADATVHRWELGNVFARPGGHRRQAPRGRARPARNVHLVGDYFAELGTWRPPPGPAARRRARRRRCAPTRHRSAATEVDQA